MKIFLQNQNPEEVLFAEEILINFEIGNDFLYDINSEKLVFNNLQAWFNYLKFLKKNNKEEWDRIIENRKLNVIYGNKLQIESTIPLIWTEHGEPIVALGENQDTDNYIVSARNRDINREDYLDVCIFQYNLQNPVELDDIITYKYKNKERLKYSNYIQSFFLPYHLGYYPGIRDHSTCRFLRDINSSIIKYKIYDRYEFERFGEKGYSDIVSPIRAIQWEDDNENFGIWIKPYTYFSNGGLNLPEGEPILINSDYAKISDFESCIGGSDNLLVFWKEDPRWVMVITYLSSRSDVFILYNPEKEWKKPNRANDKRVIKGVHLSELLWDWIKDSQIDKSISIFSETYEILLNHLQNHFSFYPEEDSEIVDRFIDLAYQIKQSR